jgi:hypothetical protein
MSNSLPEETEKTTLQKYVTTALQPFQGQQIQALLCLNFLTWFSPLSLLNLLLVSSPSSYYFIQLS